MSSLSLEYLDRMLALVLAKAAVLKGKFCHALQGSQPRLKERLPRGNWRIGWNVC
ncbi:UNVERIFIED_CONTAM: hypothetical protein Slati_1104100 [Sesamum latifolium]|uniref:Uncharacterized protein n=1 Tax=Sesamum latifolium TaxID=2727402 RepID=A0AAW2XHA4_9LAMI